MIDLSADVVEQHFPYYHGGEIALQCQHCGADCGHSQKPSKGHLTAQHVDWLSMAYEEYGHDVFSTKHGIDVPDKVLDSNFPHLVYWGLIRRPPSLSNPLTQRRGIYYVTTFGEAFIFDGIKLPEYVWQLGGRLLGAVADTSWMSFEEILDGNEESSHPHKPQPRLVSDDPLMDLLEEIYREGDDG